MNKALADLFREISILIDMEGESFKSKAYERVADILLTLEESVSDIYKNHGLEGILAISGIGEGIGKKIEEYIKSGRIKEHQRLKKKFPIDIDTLTSIEGIGPQTALKLYKKLKITNLKELEEAAKSGKIAKLPGMGEKSVERILQGIEFLKNGAGRLILGFNMPIFRSILERIKKVPGVKTAEFAGSVRRMQETVGDLDLLVISDNPKKVNDFFIHMPEVETVLIHGETRSSVRLNINIDADLRVLPSKSFGAAQQYFTGDKYHNIKLREIAIKKGYKLNEYGLFKGRKIISSENEKEIYKKLGLQWMPPELRTNTGEIEAAMEGRLPELIGYGDLKGDLQVQTDWTDGRHSIKEMAVAAKKRGLEYICITDHTKSLAMTGGNDDESLLQEIEEIDKVQKEISGIKILKGAEVNITKDGELDISDSVLSKLDVCGAAVHSNFNMTEEEMTIRIMKVMENPNVDVIFHPTGRLIGKRKPYPVDMDALLKKAKETKTVIEIDAFPNRLDLKDEYIRKAVGMGVKLAIDSDAHAAEHFDFLEFGIAQARRGWATKSDVINTLSWEEMLKQLK